MGSVLQLDPVFTDEFMAMGAGAVQERIMSPKEVELLSIALDASVTHMYAPGTRRHIKNALKAGATMEEIMEVVKLCVVQGSSDFQPGSADPRGGTGTPLVNPEGGVMMANYSRGREAVQLRWLQRGLLLPHSVPFTNAAVRDVSAIPILSEDPNPLYDAEQSSSGQPKQQQPVERLQRSHDLPVRCQIQTSRVRRRSSRSGSRESQNCYLATHPPAR